MVDVSQVWMVLRRMTAGLTQEERRLLAGACIHEGRAADMPNQYAYNRARAALDAAFGDTTEGGAHHG